MAVRSFFAWLKGGSIIVVVRAEGEVKEGFGAVSQSSSKLMRRWVLFYPSNVIDKPQAELANGSERELVGNELQASSNDFVAYIVYNVARRLCHSYDFLERCDNVVQIFVDCVFIALPGRGVFSLLKVRGEVIVRSTEF